MRPQLWVFPAATETRRATHATAKGTSAVAALATLTAREVAPLTAQFAATPPRVTMWPPAESPEMVTAPLAATACPDPPSTLTAYPLGSSPSPVVAVVTRMLAVPAVHVTS